MFNPELAEQEFQLWFADLAKCLGISPNPDTHPYDYRAAWRYLQSTGRPLSGPDFKLPDVFGKLGEGVPTFSPLFKAFKTLTPSPLAATIAQAQVAPNYNPPAPPPVSPPVAAMPKPQPTPPNLRLPASPQGLFTPGAANAGPDLSRYSNEELLALLPTEDLMKMAGVGGQPVRVEVPGMGIVEFPAGMSKEAMEAAIKEHLGGPKSVKQILNDPNFQGLPEQERLKVLRQVDPNFAGLPEAEQLKVIGAKTTLDITAFRQKYPQYADLSDQELADRLYSKYYSDMNRVDFDRKFLDGRVKPGSKMPTIPELIDKGLSDPMAESLAMFDPVAGAKELGKQVAEHGPAIGAMAGSFTRLPASVAAPITGLGVTAGGLLHRAYIGKGETIGPREEALMEAGLPFASPEMLRDFGLGVGAEFGGRGVAWAAGKLLAPAAGKLTEGAKTFIQWAKKHNLPYSPEAATPSLWRSKLAQGLADTGVGRWFTTRQRRELVEGASEAAGRVLDDFGLPQPVATTEAAGDLAGYLRNIANKKLTHKTFNEAMERIPAESEMAVPNLMRALDEIGGLTTISEIYSGGSGHAPREFGLFKRVFKRDGRITKAELDYFNKSIWRKWKDMDPEARSLAGKLKEGLLKDLDTVLDPELGQTLAVLRKAADTAYKEAETFLAETPLASAIKKAGRPEAQARQFFNLFSEPYKKDALAIREHLLSTGQKDLWDTVKASYLEGVFSRATKLSEETGERVFQPGAFINWYEKYGKGAMDIMPEHAPALREWYGVSKGLLKDFQKFGERGREVMPTLKLGILGGAGYLAGGVPGVVVANGFALLSALGTMGRGSLGFLRNYLLREAAPFGVPLIKGAAQFGGVEAAQRLNR